MLSRSVWPPPGPSRSDRPCRVCACAQFITVFLGSFIAGSVLNQATTLFKNPTSIIQILGTSAPLTSIFFLTFIELNVRAAPHTRLSRRRRMCRHDGCRLCVAASDETNPRSRSQPA